MDTTTRRSFLAAASASALSAQTKPIRVAVIGTGHRAWAHIEVMKTLSDYHIVALADPTPEFLDKAATLAPEAKTYTDYRKMLAERKDLDAVVVVTPNFLHAEVTVAALDRGLDVLCEKPMASTVEDANRMIQAAARSGRLLQIGFQKRFSPAHSKLRELAASGAVGQILYVSAHLFRGDWNPRSWKYTDPATGVAANWRYLSRTEGSALLEDGIHEIDLLHWIINDRVTRVFASGGNNVFKDRETLDHAAVTIDYASGVKFTLDFSLFAQNTGPVGRQIVILGTSGSLQPEGGKIAVRKRAGGPADYVDVEPRQRAGPKASDPDTAQLYLTFAASFRTRQPPPVGPEAGKQAVKIALLAERSIRQGRAMSWDDLPA